jgi:hypothetical protein
MHKQAVIFAWDEIKMGKTYGGGLPKKIGNRDSGQRRYNSSDQ